MAELNIYKTKTMLAAISQMVPATSFLRDRYFPSAASDIFPTEEVLVEYKDRSGNKLAPVVLPRMGDVSVERDGYRTSRMAPPLVAPSRPLTIDELNKKGFGESLFSDRTPAQRQAEILTQDLAEMDEMISNREEQIASQVIFTNGVILKQQGDKGIAAAKDYELKFYDKTNDAVYAPSNLWSAASADIMGDLAAMIRMLTTKGNNATEVLLGADVAAVLMRSEEIRKLMDLARFNVGDIAPAALSNGAARLGRLNINGRMIDLLTYDGTYIDEESGEVTSYVPAKQICVTAPGAGRALYGSVTQIEQADGLYYTHMGRRVPRYWTEKNSRELRVSSRPLFVPKTKDCFITATVLS